MAIFPQDRRPFCPFFQFAPFFCVKQCYILQPAHAPDGGCRREAQQAVKPCSMATPQHGMSLLVPPRQGAPLYMLTLVNFFHPSSPFFPLLTPRNPHRFKIFFPRPHFRPCRGIRNRLPSCSLTLINLMFLKKPVLPLVLLSTTPENPYFGQTAGVSPG